MSEIVREAAAGQQSLEAGRAGLSCDHDLQLLQLADLQVLPDLSAVQPEIEKANTQLSLKPYTISCTASPVNDVHSAASLSEYAADRRRGAIPIRRIQNVARRQVTFSKRKSSLLRKAQQLSVLCNADVGLLIFSPSGKLFQFASSSLDNLLEKYQNISTKTKDSKKCITPSHKENEEVPKLDILLEMQRTMLGKDLKHLDLTQLQDLEAQFETFIQQVSERKRQVMKDITLCCHCMPNDLDQGLFADANCDQIVTSLKLG